MSGEHVNVRALASGQRRVTVWGGRDIPPFPRRGFPRSHPRRFSENPEKDYYTDKQSKNPSTRVKLFLTNRIPDPGDLLFSFCDAREEDSFNFCKRWCFSFWGEVAKIRR